MTKTYSDMYYDMTTCPKCNGKSCEMCGSHGEVSIMQAILYQTGATADDDEFWNYAEVHFPEYQVIRVE